MTKKYVFIFALLGSLVFLLSAFQKEVGICGSSYNNCWDLVDLIWPPLSVFPALLLLSVITFKMCHEIFATWVKFAVWWIPLSIIAIILTPEEIKGSISVQLKSPLALFSAITFLLVSLCLITYKSLKLRKQG